MSDVAVGTSGDSMVTSGWRCVQGEQRLATRCWEGLVRPGEGHSFRSEGQSADTSTMWATFVNNKGGGICRWRMGGPNPTESRCQGSDLGKRQVAFTLGRRGRWARKRPICPALSENTTRMTKKQEKKRGRVQSKKKKERGGEPPGTAATKTKAAKQPGQAREKKHQTPSHNKGEKILRKPPKLCPKGAAERKRGGQDHRLRNVKRGTEGGSRWY